MTYFGLFDQKDLGDLSETSRNKLFSDHGILVKIISAKFPEGTLKPSPIFTEALYQYIQSIYEDHILSPYYEFYTNFNNELFGLNALERKKIALNHFKTYAAKIELKSVKLFSVSKKSKEIETIENFEILSILKGQQNALKSELCKTTAMNQFLEGNKDFFNPSLPERILLLQEIIYFESILKILINLNHTYRFEIDRFFVKDELAKIGSEKQEETLCKNENSLNSDLNIPENESLVPEKKLKKLAAKRPPLLTDQEAIDYLLKSVFNQ
tara:strand:- start:144098 stop:144904 length:807 start_codon:yes stop_codon:yes gene_type:complete